MVGESKLFEKDKEIGWAEGYVKFVVDKVLHLLFLLLY
jgi:hypothetical protein